VANEETYKLEELAEHAGVSARTIRYYVQRGLLPAPTFRGKDSAYGREHAVRLSAIKRLQDAHQPLDAIQEALAQRSLEEIERLAEAVDLRPPMVAPPVIAPRTAGARWTRLVLDRGLELHVSEDATPDVRALAERLRALALTPAARPDGRGGTDK